MEMLGLDHESYINTLVNGKQRKSDFVKYFAGLYAAVLEFELRGIPHRLPLHILDDYMHYLEFGYKRPNQSRMNELKIFVDRYIKDRGVF